MVAAVDRAGADDVVAQLTAGLETQLGPTWPDGVELSFGQWQKLALARGFMRDRPLLLVLDEPTAALDAETEHALFERYAAAARGGQFDARIGRTDGRITILVSHRFSTVRMADFIVVLDGRGWSNRARMKSSWPTAASTRSFTGSRRRRTAKRVPIIQIGALSDDAAPAGRSR